MSKENEPQDPVEEEPNDSEDLKSEVMEDMEVDDLVPKMDIKVSPDEPECIVGDETLIDLYEEILNNSRRDREQTDEILADFINMVMNDGESSSASKEAIVNLMKIKTDTSDKMTKVADLMTRIKLKERDTFPRYLAQQQNNKIVFDGSKRDFLKKIEDKIKKNGK